MLRTPSRAHGAIAVLHLAHHPLQRHDRLARLGDDGRQQMRDVLVDAELQHLGIDHDEAAAIRRQPVEQRQDHGVDRHRLARAGGAGDQQMRHAGEIGDHRIAADVLAERQRQAEAAVLVVPGRQQLAQEHRLAPRIGQLDADDVAAGHGGDARRHRAHRAGDVVGEADDPARLGAGRRLELVERHHRARPHLHDLAFDAEIVEHGLEQARVLLERLLVDLGLGADPRGQRQDVERRQAVFAGHQVELALAGLGGTLALGRGRLARNDP